MPDDRMWRALRCVPGPAQHDDDGVDDFLASSVRAGAEAHELADERPSPDLEPDPEPRGAPVHPTRDLELEELLREWPGDAPLAVPRRPRLPGPRAALVLAGALVAVVAVATRDDRAAPSREAAAGRHAQAAKRRWHGRRPRHQARRPKPRVHAIREHRSASSSASATSASSSATPSSLLSSSATSSSPSSLRAAATPAAAPRRAPAADPPPAFTGEFTP